jgi:quercetin dioxygenase-like cupin family protein
LSARHSPRMTPYLSHYLPLTRTRRSAHESGGDAFVTCLDGVGRITIDGVEYILHEGESIVMPAKHPHAVYGAEQFKMLLVVVF